MRIQGIIRPAGPFVPALSHNRGDKPMRMSTKLIISSSLITPLLFLTFAGFVLNRFYAVELSREQSNLEKCIQTFWETMGGKDAEFRLSDGRLLAGGKVINGNFKAPDKIQKIFGGVATVFMGDERVSTNVLDEMGKPAVGTRLVGPAYAAIFKNGRPYRGEAPILGHPYLTAYDPIRDKSGAIIGVLFVGIKKSAFLERFNQIEYSVMAMLMLLLTSMALVNYLLYRKTRKLENAEADNFHFFKTLINTIPNPIFYKNVQGRYLGFNKAYEVYLGMTHDQLVGKTSSELWPPDLAEKYDEQDRKLFANPGMQLYEGSVRIADGTRHEVIFYKATFSSEHVEVAGLVGVILDITERKRAEQETERANRQLIDIIEFLPDPTVVLDNDKRVIAWNLAMEMMSGIGKEEVLGHDYRAYAEPFFGERRPILVEMLDEEKQGIEPAHPSVKRASRTRVAEICIPGSNGKETCYLWETAALFYDKWGNRVGGIESIRDVTAIRCVEAELRFRNLLFSTQLEVSPDGMLAVDENGKIISWNNRFMDIFKIPGSLLDAGDDEPIMRAATEQAEDPEGTLERVRSIYEHPKETSKDVVALKGGIVIDRYSAPMVDETGHYHGRVWFFRDITEAKAAEAEIENAYQRVLDIIEFLPDATFVLDKEKRVIAWNWAMEKLTGVAKEEILGKGDYAYAEPFYGMRRPILVDMLDRDDDELRAHYEYVQRNGRTIFAELSLPPMGKHGARFVSSSASSLFDNKGNRVGSIQTIRDLTENRRILNEKTRIEVELQRSQLMQTVMTHLGHDLKTPLTPLLALLPIITSSLSDPHLKRMADLCCQSAGQINDLVDKTLNYAVLSSMLASVERKDIALASAVDALLAKRFRDVSCENAIAPEVVVHAEPKQLSELLANLIENAVQYSSAQGVVRIAAEQTATSVTVAVRDDGVGLAPPHLERIFDEYFKVDESRHDIGRMGLGLSICKRIVLDHQGKIWAESPGLGQGATMRFTLPRNVVC